MAKPKPGSKFIFGTAEILGTQLKILGAQVQILGPPTPKYQKNANAPKRATRALFSNLAVLTITKQIKESKFFTQEFKSLDINY